MEPRSLSLDFKEFLKCLNVHEVEYLLIGGHAVAYHGYPRSTANMDVWVEVSETNATKFVAALAEFGFGIPELPPPVFLKAGRIIRLGVLPNRIEVQTVIDGVQFVECYPRRMVAEIDGVRVNLIALEDLKTNKRACGRSKDLADLDHLP
jgi:predicted nucleotidyltransferase